MLRMLHGERNFLYFYAISCVCLAAGSVCRQNVVVLSSVLTNLQDIQLARLHHMH